jgi:hypothetical protein
MSRLGPWPLIVAALGFAWLVAMLILVEIFRYLGHAGEVFDEGVAQALKDLDAARERDRVDVEDGWRWES